MYNVSVNTASPIKLTLVISLIPIFFLLFLFGGIKEVFAINYTVTFANSNPGLSVLCSAPSGCTDLGVCWNSWAPGQTDCGQACIVQGRAWGDTWSKYDYDNCYETFKDPLTGGSLECTSLYTRVSDVCSTADKCDDGSGNPISPPSYLKAGFCNCTLGGIYKTCCTNTSPSLVASDQCVQWTNDPYNPPYEGVCPAGSG